MAAGEFRDAVASQIEGALAVQRALLTPAYLNAIVRAADLLIECFRSGGKLLLFGNGGSAADAQHWAAELVGRYLHDRRPLPAVALADSGASVTAIANDFGYEHVFSRQLTALCRPEDVAIGISTSGRSRNVIAGLSAATTIGARTIGLTGQDAGELKVHCDVCIMVPSAETPRIQEGHGLVVHILSQLIEADLVAGG